MADRNLGRIAAVITLRDLDFTSTLTKARTSVSSFGTSFGASAAKVITGGAAIAAASAAAYAAIAGVGAALDRMGKSADDAAKLGMQDMPEFLAGLQYRAKLVGVEANSVSDSLGKLFRTIAEARAGSKADQDILSTLGLSVASLSGQSPDKVVLRVADALDQVADSGERARLAVALFGRSGANMVNVLRGGSSGITGSVREAQSLGVARSASDLAVADAAGDALDRTRMSIDGLWNTLTVQLSPAITSVAEAITRQIQSTNEQTEGMRKLEKEAVNIAARVANAVQGLYNGFDWMFNAGTPGYELPSEYMGDIIKEEYRLVEIRREVAERERQRTQKLADEKRKTDEKNAAFASAMSAKFAEKQAAIDEARKRQQDEELARIAAAEELQRQNLELAEQVAGMIGGDGGIARAIPEISGGAPLIMSGSAEAQMAQFNAANMRVQTTAERQLSATERIDKAIMEIKRKAEEDTRLIQQILARIPAVQPI